MADKPVLCYVRPPFAFFTTQELSKQWGDDWNDAPYEHNAGSPYEPRNDELVKWEIIKIAFESDLETPADKAYANSAYSVEMINAGTVAWLASPYWTEQKVSIMAGTTIDDFIATIEASGGTVYLPRNPQNH